MQTLKAKRLCHFAKALTLSVVGGFRVCLDQRPSFLRVFRMSFEVGLEARGPYAECPECPALAKCGHHPRCFFV
jgi:hypothetical protein